MKLQYAAPVRESVTIVGIASVHPVHGSVYHGDLMSAQKHALHTAYEGSLAKRGKIFPMYKKTIAKKASYHRTASHLGLPMSALDRCHD